MRRTKRHTPLLDRFRSRLAEAEALPQICTLAIAVGLLTAAVTLLFRALIQFSLEWLLPGGESENFEGLAAWSRLVAPLLGAAVIGLILSNSAAAHRDVGVVHVMTRLARHEGHLPGRNAIVQFIAGIVALISGQSAGREGPAIHLGAATSSLLGQRFQLPNNSIRTLVACGTAAAIAASFNTPLAGVIFAMEVVMMEYRMVSFVPVMLAAITATLLSIVAYGDHAAFDVPDEIRMVSVLEVPYIIVEGFILGCLAALFIGISQWLTRTIVDSLWIRLTFASALTGIIAVFVPQVMGIGYDTVESTLDGDLPLGLLIAVTFSKLLASAVSFAMRIPAGIIGPTLVIGAVAGGAIGHLGDYIANYLGHENAHIGLYAMLGMGAMMAAVLQAPLAALLAVVELTGNPNITLPAMLAIVVATITSRVVFNQQSIFIAALERAGIAYPPDAISQQLNRVGVTSTMERRFSRINYPTSGDDLDRALARQPVWIIIELEGDKKMLLPAEELRAFINNGAGQSDLPLTEARSCGEIDEQSTLQQAAQLMTEQQIDAMLVTRQTNSAIRRVLGVIAIEDVDRITRN